MRRYAAYVRPASIASTCAQVRRQLKSGSGGVGRWDFRVASQGPLGEDRQDGAENPNECRRAVYVGAVSALRGEFTLGWPCHLAVARVRSLSQTIVPLPPLGREAPPKQVGQQPPSSKSQAIRALSLTRTQWPRHAGVARSGQHWAEQSKAK